MQINNFKNHNQLANYIGNYWAELQNNANSELFIAPSPSRESSDLFDWLVTNCHSLQNWDKLKVFLTYDLLRGEADIQYLDKFSEDSFARYIRNNLFKLLKDRKPDIPTESIFVQPILATLTNYDEMITANSGLDLVIVYPNRNGVYARVMPGTAAEKGYHLTKMTQDLINIGPAGQTSSTEIMKYAMSLGPKQLTEAKKLFVVIDENSQPGLAAAITSYQNFDPLFPISIINDLDTEKYELLVVTED